MKDIRWQPRFSNYQKALKQLQKFVEKPFLSELEEQGLIKAFEYTYELAWTSLKDFLEFQGFEGLIGSRDTLREAFRQDLLSDGEVWMDMLQSRNMTSHSYNEETANKISNIVITKYYSLFLALEKKLASKLIIES